MSANAILGLTGSLLVLALVFELLRRRRLREKYASFWVGIATLTLLVAAVPDILFWASDILGVEVPANLLFFVASMVLFAVSIQHSHELGRLEEQSRVLAEEVALLKVSQPLTDPRPSDVRPAGD